LLQRLSRRQHEAKYQSGLPKSSLLLDLSRAPSNIEIRVYKIRNRLRESYKWHRGVYKLEDRRREGREEEVLDDARTLETRRGEEKTGRRRAV